MNFTKFFYGVLLQFTIIEIAVHIANGLPAWEKVIVYGIMASILPLYRCMSND